ncbi:uncharacterized protein LOC135222836 [Macrobrachium nipponense]|uniref:uncharacterized protein LOC135222836 n=1 Tax=Macrobrachium nipponense TaxID=159736 RepID=UPI0030C84917
MSMENLLFDHLNNPSFTTCLAAMRPSLVNFSKIHSKHIFKNQVANAHETYMPAFLEWGDSYKVSVNDLFATDFTDFYGTYDATTNLHQPRVFVIFGAEGSGKSALANYLHYQWIFPEAKDVKNIDDFHLATVFEADKAKEMDDLPKLSTVVNLAYFPKNKHTDQITTSLVASKILWLVDGFEGASEEVQSVVKELILKFPSSKFVITSRWSGITVMNDLFFDLEYKIPTVTMRLLPLFGNSWKSMVPRMIAAKTRRSEIIEEASSQFIAKYDDEISLQCELFPSDLAVAVQQWLDVEYDFLKGENLD